MAATALSGCGLGEFRAQVTDDPFAAGVLNARKVSLHGSLPSSLDFLGDAIRALAHEVADVVDDRLHPAAITDLRR
ncbi:MAG TPA: hypothetical protein VLW50_18340 [Streptosporangiaceae bacterium]|nr:hypothetical protein [Streptosporangiaceae bacterium]